MSSVYEELIEEGRRIKSEHQKSKYINKLFIRLITIVIYTYIMCYAFFKINLIFNFYNEFIFSIIFIIVFFLMLIWIERKNKKKQARTFSIYIVLFAINLLSYCSFSNIMEMLVKIVCVSILFFTMMKIGKCKNKKYNMAIVALVLLILILNTLGLINSRDFILFELALLLTSYIFKKINNLVKSKNETVEILQNNFYGHLFCIYTLFMIVCILII